MIRKVLYLEGRPHAHPLHRRLAESLGCVVDYIDAQVRWQDLDLPFLSNVLRWFINARYLSSKYSDYNVFLVDNLHFTPVIMNFFFLRNRKRLMVHLGSHTLYFMHNGEFSKINLWLHKKALQQYDVLLCEGEMAKQLAKNLLREKLPPTYVTFLGIPTQQCLALKAIKPDLESHTILIIANGPSSFRAHYKGLDVMIKAFAQASLQLPNLRLRILGDWTEDMIKQLTMGINEKSREHVRFIGRVSSINSNLAGASLCLHCTRGDAFPTATLEAMMAGVPVILSEWTGTKEVIEQVDMRLIVSMNELAIMEKIVWYYHLEPAEKLRISQSCKRTAENYTEEHAIDHYQKTFKKIGEDLGI